MQLFHIFLSLSFFLTPSDRGTQVFRSFGVLETLSLREPIFVLDGETADDGGFGIYYGLGYTVKMEKHIDAEGGAVLDAVELRLLGKTVAASIT